jgi:Nucleotidyl transferase AbiEii toxin, Type IV TA system
VRKRPASGEDSVLALLQTVGAAEIGDWFSFRVGEATTDLDGAPYGGSRYPVEARMAGPTFVKFHLDVGIGDVIVDPAEEVRTRDWFGFAGVDAARAFMIQSEQQFAEQVHAYTLPREGAPNSRAQDLVDLALLVQSGIMDKLRVAAALRRTFTRRGTHELPGHLTAPPEHWAVPFARMAEECALKIYAAAAFHEVALYLGDVLALAARVVRRDKTGVE